MGRVKITAHHMGFFEFRICDQPLDGSVVNPEACLNQRRLQRAAPASDCVVNDVRGDCQPVDTRHPERWYLSPGTGDKTMRYEIPADFAAQGWDQGAWCGAFCGACSSLLEANRSSSAILTSCGEEFRNCADIAGAGAGETMASTTVVTTSSEPEAEPESEPEDETSSIPPASPSQCGSCMGCMWSHGLCHMDASK